MRIFLVAFFIFANIKLNKIIQVIMKCFNDYIVNTSILRQNGKNIKSLIGDNVKYCAVVKANGYGCGIETICKSLKGVADYFACACTKEALQIRAIDNDTKILILGMVDFDDIEELAENNISISISCLDQLEELNSVLRKRINIHLQINTGLNRFGIRSLGDLRKALKIIDGNKCINLEGMYSHFATKQDDVNFINKQYFRFLQFKKRVEDRNVICHIANSYATLKDERYRLDMIRSGFLTYGYQNNSIGNKSAIKIQSKIVNILSVKKGDTIGYDRTFKASKNMKIAIVPIGYADGLSRGLSNKFYVLISGVRCPIVGRICMDVCMVDIGGIGCVIGERVVVLGCSGRNSITIQNMSKVLEASPYEIICNFRYNRMNYIIE